MPIMVPQKCQHWKTLGSVSKYRPPKSVTSHEMVLMEEFEFKVVYGLGSGDYRSVNKVLKVVKFGVGVGVGGSLG